MSKEKKSQKIRGPEYIFNFIQTFYELLLINSGNKLNLYDLIDQNKSISSKKLSLLSGYPEKLINSWCDAATSIDHLQKKDGNYNLSRWSKNYLCKDSPSYLGFLIENVDYMLSINQNIREIFNNNFPKLEGSRAIKIIKSIAPIANFMVPFLINEIPKLKETCEVLDLGCGLGHYLVKLAKLNPRLRGIGVEGGWGIEVVNEAKRHIKKSDMENQIQIIYSDVFKFETKQKFDIILMSNFLQAFQIKDAQIIFHNCYKWLNDQGVIVIQDNLINEDGLSPQFNALFNFYLSLESPNARLYYYQELIEMLENAKFSKINKYDILFGMSHIIAKKEI